MSKGYLDNNKDIDSEAIEARDAEYRHSFIAKMEAKLKAKEALAAPEYR